LQAIILVEAAGVGFSAFAEYKQLIAKSVSLKRQVSQKCAKVCTCRVCRPYEGEANYPLRANIYRPRLVDTLPHTSAFFPSGNSGRHYMNWDRVASTLCKEKLSGRLRASRPGADSVVHPTPSHPSRQI